MPNRKILTFAIAITLLCILALIAYNLPPIHNRLTPRVDSMSASIQYRLNPPDEAVFVPQEQVEQLPHSPSPTASPTIPPPSPTPTSTGPTSTTQPTLEPTVTSTPLPEYVSLDGVVYVDQHNRWNYCGPANLTMALNF